MRTQLLIGSVLTLAMACSSSKPPATTTTATPTEAQRGPGMHGGPGMHAMHGPHGQHGGMCPMEVPDTHATVADTADGVAIVFTTTGDVAQLRDRVRHMAAMHDGMMAKDHGNMTMHPHHAGPGMVPSTARAEDVEGGARIVLTPKDPAQLAELRSTANAHVAQMAGGHCPMMHEG